MDKLNEMQRKSATNHVKAVSTDMGSDTARYGNCEVKENTR
jgi:hypothetical protein